ncbi:MAG: 23S rRNA pseudouridine(1911/1915/1917) synthase RluD [Alteromonadaceae bacterium]|nr:MAG: 23S rRNA pseudouridine(1911/1915/1917) synthase RluD [Alteromonadaceae bacterium]
MSDQIIRHAKVPPERTGHRFDQVAVEMFPDYSRGRIQAWIKDGSLLLNGSVAKPKLRLCGGETLALNAVLEVQGEWEAQDIPINIVYEDESLMVVDKPAGLVVHPGAGNPDGTLLNALLHHNPAIAKVPRAGIVHRLDKGTTGLMVVAKTIEAQTHLVGQLQDRSVNRHYLAVAHGELSSDGHVDAAMDRHPSARTKMAVVEFGGKHAVTHYAIEAQFQGFTLLKLKLETGRTHQIRVHMAHLGHGLLGDATYGQGLNQAQVNKNVNLQPLMQFGRQALHATTLGLVHPSTGEYCEWDSPMPEDMQALVAHLERCF